MKFYRITKNIILSLLSYKTIGVRALVIKSNKVLLVEHTYMSGWYTIGGAVEKGETPKQAIERELAEEVGIKATHLQLFNVYHSRYEKRDDYIIFYICNDFIDNNTRSLLEIKDKGWFELEKLPKNISPSTLKRIQEYQNKISLSDEW